MRDVRDSHRSAARQIWTSSVLTARVITFWDSVSRTEGRLSCRDVFKSSLDYSKLWSKCSREDLREELSQSYPTALCHAEYWG